MTKIYVIRHAEAEGNLYRIAQGQYNSIITTRGHRQIAALRRRFEGVQVDAVYSSDLYRTCVTASALYEPRGLTLHRRRDLREICVGEWEQKTWGEITRDQPEQMWNFTHRLDLWRVPGGEAPEQVRDRVMHAIREIAAENEGRTVAVFSHGCAIQILLATIEGYGIPELAKTSHGDNTAVSLIEVEGEQMHVVFRDDSSHLSNPEYTGGPLSRRPSSLEPGLWFEPMQMPDHRTFLSQCVSSGWSDAGDPRTWSEEAMLSGMERHPTMVGLLRGEPVGVVQFHPEKEQDKGYGWISLYCIEEDYRKQGFGVQLLGQAVAYYRPLGRKALRLAVPAENRTIRAYFADYGFHPVRKTKTGREILEKDISYHPEYCGPDGCRENP